MKFERIDHPLATQRVNGRAALGVRLVDDRTRISVLEQAGAAKIRLPVTPGDPLEAILINTAGGMTGGDRLDWTINVGPGAAALLTTQACEKAYRSVTGEAAIATRLNVGDGGRLAWLPQETIIYDGSSLSRRIDLHLAGNATALVVEATIFGRKAMGETVRRARFRDKWRVRRDGRLFHAEDLLFDGDVGAQLDRAAVGGGATSFATVLFVGPASDRLIDDARAIVGPRGGVSSWTVGTPPESATGKLLARLVADDGYDLRRRLVPLLVLLNGQASLPKVWSL